MQNLTGRLRKTKFRRRIIALAILVFLGGAALKTVEITGNSPTFDEPFHLFQGVYQHQERQWYMKDIHPPLMPWMVGAVSPWLADFRQAKVFSVNKDWYDGPYQYRVDEFSRLPSDLVIQRARLFFQLFWVIGLLSVWICARKMGMNPWGQFTLLSFLLLEPTFLGLSALMSSDVLVLSFLSLGTVLSLGTRRWQHGAAWLAFSLAWATKFTALLWFLPLVLGFRFSKVPIRSLALWALGMLGGLALTWKLGGWDPGHAYLLNPNTRGSFLDGVIQGQTSTTYFLQALLCKASLAVWVLGVWAWSFYRKAPENRANWLLVSLVAGLLGCSAILPGLGVRLILPVFAALLFLLCFSVRTEKVALLLVALVAAESLWSWDSHLAYQNPLAGSTPRLLDSNRDWGQGLKDLAEWKSVHPDSEIALALFGGTYPEVYGLEKYHTLPSFPLLTSGTPLTQGKYSGYVAVSANFLKGYAVHFSSLRILDQKTPVQCFRGALCLYDVREAK